MSGEPYHSKPSADSTATPWRGVLAAAVVLAAACGAPAASTRPGPTAEPDGLQALHLDAQSSPRSGNDFELPPVSRAVLDTGSGPEQIFRGDLVSMRAVPTFSRATRALDTSDGEGFDAVFNSTAAVNASGATAAASPGAELSETIFALQSDSSASRSPAPEKPDDSLFTRTSSTTRGPRKAGLMFWEDAADAEVLYASGDVASAAGGRGAGANLVIPLPAAAWSGLSLMFGVSLMAGVRRLRNRLRR